MRSLRVTHVTPSVSRLGGGLFESVRHLSQETHKNGVEVEVVSLRDAYSDEDMGRWNPLPMYVFPVIGPKAFGYSPQLSDHLTSSHPDIVHLHGVWQYPTSSVLKWARSTGKPYVVSSHGMLEPWALQRSRYKKALVNFLYQNTCLKEATCLRATAASEVESIRNLGFKNPIALIANGVPTPPALAPLRMADPTRKQRALFLSRIHPKKGLLDLVHAWNQVRPANWELVLIGPDERGHLAEVMAAVRQCGLVNQILYGGEVWDEKSKMQCYFDADLFVLPSYSENFGLVIAEALGCGIPVITTHPTPWQDLETFRCGWWIDTGVRSLTIALKSALATSPEELCKMGLRGRELVIQKYGWTPLGKQMAEVYQWLAGRTTKPDYVV